MTRVLSMVANVLAISAGGMSGARPGSQELRLADVAGRYWMSDGRHRRWTVTVRANGTFTSRRLVGDILEDARQPRGGVASVSMGDLFLVVPPGDEAYTLVPIKLGKRLYLLRPGSELEFCIAVAEGREPRRSDVGDSLLRVGDERIPVPKGTVPELCERPGPHQ